MTNKSWLNSNSDISWICYNEMLARNWSFWSSTTSLITSMSLGTQKGFIANPVNAPNNLLRS